MIAPTPSVVRLNGPSVRRSVSVCASAVSSSTDFRVKSPHARKTEDVDWPRTPGTEAVCGLSEPCQSVEPITCRSHCSRARATPDSQNGSLAPRHAYRRPTRLALHAARGAARMHARPGDDARLRGARRRAVAPRDGRARVARLRRRCRMGARRRRERGAPVVARRRARADHARARDVALRAAPCAERARGRAPTTCCDARSRAAIRRGSIFASTFATRRSPRRAPRSSPAMRSWLVDTITDAWTQRLQARLEIRRRARRTGGRAALGACVRGEICRARRADRGVRISNVCRRHRRAADPSV